MSTIRIGGQLSHKDRYQRVHISGRKCGEIGNAARNLIKEQKEIAEKIWQELLSPPLGRREQNASKPCRLVDNSDSLLDRLPELEGLPWVDSETPTERDT